MKIATAQLWVHDQDEALAFSTQKLGMEVRSDVTVPEMGNFRWLTVGAVGQPDVHARDAELSGRGVQFIDQPTPMLYGIDSSFRDPSGNQFRLAQLDRTSGSRSATFSRRGGAPSDGHARRR